jgi:hypothetical protein
MQINQAVNLVISYLKRDSSGFGAKHASIDVFCHSCIDENIAKLLDTTKIKEVYERVNWALETENRFCEFRSLCRLADLEDNFGDWHEACEGCAGEMRNQFFSDFNAFAKILGIEPSEAFTNAMNTMIVEKLLKGCECSKCKVLARKFRHLDVVREQRN